LAIIPVCILASWETVAESRLKLFISCYLVLESVIIAVFTCCWDLFMFYFVFEFVYGAFSVWATDFYSVSSWFESTIILAGIWSGSLVETRYVRFVFDYLTLGIIVPIQLLIYSQREDTC